MIIGLYCIAEIVLDLGYDWSNVIGYRIALLDKVGRSKYKYQDLTVEQTVELLKSGKKILNMQLNKDGNIEITHGNRLEYPTILRDSFEGEDKNKSDVAVLVIDRVNSYVLRCIDLKGDVIDISLKGLRMSRDEGDIILNPLQNQIVIKDKNYEELVLPNINILKKQRDGKAMIVVQGLGWDIEPSNNLIIKKRSIKELKVPDGVQMIAGKYAIEYFENLVYVDFPQSVIKLDPNTFRGCPKLNLIMCSRRIENQVTKLAGPEVTIVTYD